MPTVAWFTGWGCWGDHPENMTLHFVRKDGRAGLCGRKMGGWHLAIRVPQDPRHPQNRTAIYCERCKSLAMTPEQWLEEARS